MSCRSSLVSPRSHRKPSGRGPFAIGVHEIMFHAWPWSILSPRLWVERAQWRLPAALPPEQKISERGLRQQVRTRTLHHRQDLCYLALAGTPSCSTLRLRQECMRSTNTPSRSTLRLRQEQAQHQHSVEEYIAPAPEVYAAPACRLVRWPSTSLGVQSVRSGLECTGMSVRRLRGDVHGSKSRRPSWAPCLLSRIGTFNPTSQLSLVECDHLGRTNLP